MHFLRRICRIILFLLIFTPILFADEYQMQFPTGIPADLWKILIPTDNPMSAAKVELGKQLYFDKRLSGDDTVSCATCHIPKQGFQNLEDFDFIMQVKVCCRLI